jgi:hypothetical protein
MIGPDHARSFEVDRTFDERKVCNGEEVRRDSQADGTCHRDATGEMIEPFRERDIEVERV